MTKSAEQNSATIYQFPAGGRSALGGRRDVVKPAESLAAPRTVKVASGGSWYHEEAVEDARLGRTN